MRARLARALGQAGLGSTQAQAVLLAHDRAGLHRAERLPPDEEDPRWLHPGRVLVIALDDGGLRDPGWLALAAGADLGMPGLMEKRVVEALREVGVRPWAEVGGELVGGAEGGTAGESGGETGAAPPFRAPVPLPDAAFDAWRAQVAALPPEGQTLVLADALDHLRHLHLAPPGPNRARTARLASAHFLPLAEGAGGVAARRFAWWCRRVAPGLAASPDFDSC
jgi:hypothetical protein